MLATLAAGSAMTVECFTAVAAINLVEQIVKGGVIAYAIVALSLGLLTLSIVYVIHLRYAAQCPDELLEETQERVLAGHFSSAADILASDPSCLAAALEALMKRRKESVARLEETLSETVSEQTMQMSQRISYIALIAAIAPMLGLLGTVSGMIQAFATMSATPSAPDASQLAGAISEALITTYLGLIVAMPALVVHTVLKHRVFNISQRVGEMGEQFIESMRACGPAGRKASGGPDPRRSPAGPAS